MPDPAVGTRGNELGREPGRSVGGARGPERRDVETELPPGPRSSIKVAITSGIAAMPIKVLSPPRRTLSFQPIQRIENQTINSNTSIDNRNKLRPTGPNKLQLFFFFAIECTERCKV